MSTVSRGWTKDEGRRQADATRWPVLARLPDVLGDSAAPRSDKLGSHGGIEYRFDPPQPGNSGKQSPEAVQSATSQQPHIFERGRPKGQRGIPRRESSILPRSNPFSNPRPRLVDSIAPAVRFLTMVVLFTAAGVWVQMMGRQTSSSTQLIDTPKTAAQPAAMPAKNADDHTVPAPTATGPIETQPDSGARVGRAADDDFASRSNSAAGPVPTARPMASPPHFLISSGSNVPRVRVADSNASTAADTAQGAADSTTNVSNSETAAEAESDGSPEVARYPGFFMDIPTR